MDQDQVRRLAALQNSARPAPITTEAILENAKAAENALNEAREEAERKKESAKSGKIEVTDGVEYSFVGFDRPEIRAAIEKRSSPISLDDLLFSGKVTQRINIIPNKLEITLSTIADSVSTWCEAYATRETLELHGGLTKIAAMRSARLSLAASIVAVNSQQFLPIRLKDGLPDTTAPAETNIIARTSSISTMYDSTVVNILLANMLWFNARTRLLLSDALFLDDGSVTL